MMYRSQAKIEAEPGPSPVRLLHRAKKQQASLKEMQKEAVRRAKKEEKELAKAKKERASKAIQKLDIDRILEQNAKRLEKAASLGFLETTLTIWSEDIDEVETYPEVLDYLIAELKKRGFGVRAKGQSCLDRVSYSISVS